jgi:hypothetical protein
MFYPGKPLKNRFGRTFNTRSSGLWIICNVSDTQLYGFGGGRIKPEDFPEPEKEVYKRAFQTQQNDNAHRSESSSANFRQICVFPAPPIPHIRKLLGRDTSRGEKNTRSLSRQSSRPVKRAL